jgi:hypothetical protein
MQGRQVAVADRAGAVGALHVTNGDSAGATLRATGLGGAVLCWRDVLTEGPLPAVAPDALRELRARFLSDRSWGAVDELSAGMRERDRALARALADGRHVVLWFEHDLYDQLQLLQVLAQVAAARAPLPRVELILVGAFEGRPDFRGLGELTAAELASLWPSRRPLEEAAAALAADAWAAVRAPDPRAIVALLERDDAALAHLSAALRRLLEELPDAVTGLSRSERQALELLAGGPRTALDVFLAAQDLEEAPFDGDTSAFARIAQLGAGERALVARADGERLPGPPRGDDRAFGRERLALTADGRAVLAGEADAVALRGIDRWVGGTHLRAGHVWRWDARAGALVEP